jgi:hypothetical protein
MIDKNSDEAKDLQIALNQVQKLELENQIMKEKMVPLIYENEDLRNQLKDQQRLRSQIKGTLKALDSMFVTHIDKLNSHKPSHEVSIGEQFGNLKAPEAILLKIEASDIKSFYNKKAGISVQDRPGYVIVNSIYVFIKTVLRTMLMWLWKGLKMVKRVIR